MKEELLGRELLELNNLQKKYEKKVYVKITYEYERFHFDYNINFDYFPIYGLDLDDFTNDLVDIFFLKPLHFVNIYVHSLMFLSEKLNKHDIGICMSEDVECYLKDYLSRF